MVRLLEIDNGSMPQARLAKEARVVLAGKAEHVLDTAVMHRITITVWGNTLRRLQRRDPWYGIGVDDPDRRRERSPGLWAAVGAGDLSGRRRCSLMQQPRETIVLRTPQTLSPAAAGSVTAVMVGTEETRLVVLRGNSASGKSSVAAGLRERFGRGLALVGQDNLRRIVLRERDRPGAANIGLIDLTARYALNAGFHVVVEGILYADHYGDMLAALRADHRGPTHGYYLDVPFGETLARHATKPIADDVSKRQLRDWYRPRDLLPGGIETVIGADSALHETVDRIMLDTGLAHLPAVDR